MTAAPALIALEPPAIDESMLVVIATRTPEPIGPAGLLQSGLTLRIGAVEPLELRQGKTFLELDGIASHGLTNIRVLPYRPSPPCAELAG